MNDKYFGDSQAMGYKTGGSQGIAIIRNALSYIKGKIEASPKNINIRFDKDLQVFLRGFRVETRVLLSESPKGLYI